METHSSETRKNWEKIVGAANMNPPTVTHFHGQGFADGTEADGSPNSESNRTHDETQSSVVINL